MLFEDSCKLKLKKNTKKDYTLIFALLLLFGIIYPCTKEDNDNEATWNSEITLFERSTTTTNSVGSTSIIQLDQNLRKTVQIKYENDIFNDIRTDENWLKLVKK